MFKNLDVKEIKELIRLEEVTILDIRSNEEYEKDKISGAINIPFDDYDFEESIDELSKEKPLIVYCKVGIRSLKAINIIEDYDFVDIYNLIGGIDKWRGKGYEVE